MKIAVTSTGEGLESAVDPRFGRAAFFVVLDTESDGYEVVRNTQNLQAAQGAGIQSAQRIVDLGCDVVISGHLGPKAFAVLKAAGVRMVLGASGAVADVRQSYLAGELSEAEAPDVEGHW